jgi:hypothetical protein
LLAPSLPAQRQCHRHATNAAANHQHGLVLLTHQYSFLFLLGARLAVQEQVISTKRATHQLFAYQSHDCRVFAGRM